MDVLYAINTKKEPAAFLPKSAAKLTTPPTGSTISIADLLESVKENFPDVLSMDVLKHFGITQRPEGELGHSGGNPVLIFILDEYGKNNAPLYAVMEFYSNKPINGSFAKRPHINLTIAQRDYTDNHRTGYEEIISNAVKGNRVVFFDTKKDDLSVIADTAGIGNITESSLKDNLSQFRKEVKNFRENKLKKKKYAEMLHCKKGGSL